MHSSSSSYVTRIDVADFAASAHPGRANGNAQIRGGLGGAVGAGRDGKGRAGSGAASDGRRRRGCTRGRATGGAQLQENLGEVMAQLKVAGMPVDNLQKPSTEDPSAAVLLRPKAIACLQDCLEHAVLTGPALIVVLVVTLILNRESEVSDWAPDFRLECPNLSMPQPQTFGVRQARNLAGQGNDV